MKGTTVRPAHVTAPRLTLYKPAAVSFARHRKPNRRALAWHADNVVASLVLAIGERGMRNR